MMLKPILVLVAVVAWLLAIAALIAGTAVSLHHAAATELWLISVAASAFAVASIALSKELQ